MTLYTQKISRQLSFEIRAIKAKPLAREQAAHKILSEGEQLLSQLKPDDYVIVFDQRGRGSKSSEHFAESLTRVWEMGKSRVVFVVGGAFGLSEKLRARANLTLSLGPLTFNHHVAILVALEQIYRASTIWKSIPYHN